MNMNMNLKEKKTNFKTSMIDWHQVVFQWELN